VVGHIKTSNDRPGWQTVSHSVLFQHEPDLPFLPNPRYDPLLHGLDMATQLRLAEDPQREHELREHFLPRARGVESAAEVAWRFVGRHAALAELAAWLADPDPPARVVTGDPGSGKSAVLGRLVVLADTPLNHALIILDTCFAGHGGAEALLSGMRVSARAPDKTLVVLTAGHPREQVRAGDFAGLFASAVRHPATAGHEPRYLPLGGVVVGAKVAAPFWEDGAWFRHGPTYSGHPTVCAAAMANLDIIEREGLLARGRELEDEIGPALRPLGDHPLVGEIRTGIGALGAIAFAGEALAEAPDLPARLFAALRERGVLLRPLGDALAFSPPLVITREEVEHVAEVAAEALEAVARDVPAAVGAR